MIIISQTLDAREGFNIISQALCAKTTGCGWFNHGTSGCFLKTAKVNNDNGQIIWMILGMLSRDILIVG